MKIDICIPTLNEEEIIIDTLSYLYDFASKHPEFDWHFIVVDNGSIDRTAELAAKIEKSNHSVIVIPERGKGRAVKIAATISNADIFGYIDADLSVNPEYLIDLIREIRNGASVAVGSRLVELADVNRSQWRTLTSKLFNFYASFMVPVPVLDTQCGIKIMDQRGKEILVNCEETGWFFDREFIAKVAKTNLPISEVAVHWEEFYYPNRKSKLNILKEGFISLLSLYKIRRSVKKYNYGKKSV